MRFSRVVIPALGIALLIGVLSTVSVKATTTQQGPVTVKLQRVGTSSFASAPPATDVSGVPDEIDSALNGGDADGGNGTGAGIGILDLLRMKLIKIDYGMIVRQKIALLQSGVNVKTREMEAHVLSRSADSPYWNYRTSAESFCIERPHGPVYERQ